MIEQTGPVGAAVAAAYRAEWAQVLATVIRVSRDIDLAEDCVHDAFAQALQRWPRDGVPHRPGAWLTTVAVRSALQGKRRTATAACNLPALALADDGGLDDPAADTVFAELPDDRLRLIFTCCHPALSAEARVALTLRLIGGLSSTEVARAFLVQPSTMQARITRAKKRILDAGIGYRAPAADELPARLESVFDTIQLIFNAGYLATDGEHLLRADLLDRAVQIARMLSELLPAEPEPAALYALLQLTDARRAARVDAAGRLVPLDEQDRSQWDRGAIADGLDRLHAALGRGATGRYAVMACIAAVHAEAATPADTDWAQIVELYDVLVRRWPSPVVELNRAIAIGAASGPAAGLAALAALAEVPALATYPYRPAARADFLRRLGQFPAAAEAYREALLLVDNGVEADYLQRRLREVSSD